MLIPKLEITNPQAIELISKIKSREIFIPLITWLKKNKWYFISGFIVIILIVALIVGKKLSEGASVPVFTPPEIESPSPTTINIPQSEYSNLKGEIQNLNTELPDPYIPTFDNGIDLEETVM